LESFMSIKSLSALVLALLSSLAMAAVELNAADQATLESVRGIGPTLSAKLLAERQKAPFKDWADVVERVPGVGLASAAKLSAAGLTVQGKPMSAPPATAARRPNPN
jgi:competence protein ComEA